MSNVSYRFKFVKPFYLGLSMGRGGVAGGGAGMPLSWPHPAGVRVSQRKPATRKNPHAPARGGWGWGGDPRGYAGIPTGVEHLKRKKKKLKKKWCRKKKKRKYMRGGVIL